MQHDPSLTNAEIYTQHHRYSGMVTTRGYRLADLLNDASTEALEIHDAHVSEPLNVRSEPVHCPHLLLKKDAILLAYPCGGHEAPQRRLYSFVEKQQYLARIVMPGHVLLGTVHLPSRATPWMIMSERGTEPSFMPMTDVTVHFAATDVEPLRTRVVLFRRRLIESIFLSDKQLNQHSDDATDSLSGMLTLANSA
jgi:hypothetical protein